MVIKNRTNTKLGLLMSRLMKACLLAVAILPVPCSSGQDKVKRIGEIEFFGYGGIDLNKVRAALPFQEGDEFSIETGTERVAQVKEAVRRVTGRPPADIALTCCDKQGDWIIYIGLSGKRIPHNPRPAGSARLPGNALDLYDRFMKALTDAVQAGAAAEDRSKGYALSEHPPLRSAQLEMRAYAIDREAMLRRVVETSSDDLQRAVAAQLLGYARQSGSQMKALARASHDSDSTVRNNATRALIVLVESNPKLAGDVPAEGFIELLLSGSWTDLNKAGFLLSAMTRGRNPRLLAGLGKAEVAERLIEMARWRTEHAEAARYILGRVAGVEEARLQHLVRAGEVEAILKRLREK